MVSISRYKPKMIRQFIDDGYWGAELTVDYWERNARHRPGAEALADGSMRLNWAEAWDRIDRLSGALIDQGFAKDDVVLVQAGNSAWLMLFRLACERAGVIPVFLHYGFRRREIEHIIRTTRPVGAVVGGASEKFDLPGLYRDLRAEHAGLRKIFVMEGPGEPEMPSIPGLIENPPPGPAPSAAAVESRLAERRFAPGELTSIVTSSGTTGAPKSIEYSVWPRLASGRVYIKRLGLTSGDAVALFLPLYTGPGDMFYHTAPQVGARQILLETFSPEAACRLVETEKPSVVILVPTMLHRILGHPGFAAEVFASLRYVSCGGSVLPYEIGRRVEASFGAKIVQAYGLMDCGAVASHAADDSQETRLRTQGKPLDGTEVRILDEHAKSVPAGEIGEVCARGPHCNGDYIGDEDATAAAWRDGFFHTGDLGRLDADGYVILEGRSKDIIIRGGQNISAKEIEAVLAHHPAIKEAVAVSMPDAEMGERACVFVVPAGEQDLTLAEVARFMKARGVATFKIPERLELIDELPVTPGGNKVDKKALEEMLS
ncbi:MAG: AMP-binding protein [Rhodospirillales bacterium]|jgi:non-ribosomal peptide synthetase component E (peptide arylation enzyme)|nr:hypothetical protein [Rhodospirillaceae bacterium]MDP6429420.1 AMP-binding protein [Rhodospirillales bacterium]MDP6643571.1 AMP-binding protein [Rhodospirillales bacterium]MDP6840990.1 AMP-binding protein [Rhodospirillales bacterium]